MVRRILVQREATNLVKRVVLLRDRLRQVERVEAVGLRILVRHDLDRQSPGRELATLNGVEQVATVEVSILTSKLRSFLVRHVLNTLIGVEVVDNPELLASLVHPHVGERGVAVHVTPGAGQAAVTHEVRNLVSRLGGEGPEVPLHVVRTQARVGHALLRVNEVRELHGIANKEDRRIVADHVEVALFGVELQGKAAYIAPGVRGAKLASNRRETGQHLGLLARLEEVGLRVGGNILKNLERAESARALRVRATLGNALAVEACKLLNKSDVVEEEGAVSTDAQRMSIRFARCTSFGCRFLRKIGLSHGQPSSFVAR